MRSVFAQLVAALGVAAALSGCANPGPPIPPTLEIPQPVSDLRAVRKGNTVKLSWTVPTRTTERQSIRHRGETLVCRALEPEMKECGSPLARIPATITAGEATYTDILPTESDGSIDKRFTYAVEARNNYSRAAGLSNRVQVSRAPALSPPAGFSAILASDGVHLSWSCPNIPEHSTELHYRVRVLRRQADNQAQSRVGEADATDCRQPQMIDTNFEWEKEFSYWAFVVTVVAKEGQPVIEVDGDDTQEVSLLAHDSFPPAVPAGLQAVFSGVGQKPFIDLVWTPDTDADLAGYIVYRHEGGGTTMRLNTNSVKAPAFRDDKVEPGKHYFYSVSAVDVRGNESARSEEAEESVPQQ